MVGRRVDGEHGESPAGRQRDTVAQLDDDEDQPGGQLPVTVDGGRCVPPRQVGGEELDRAEVVGLGTDGTGFGVVALDLCGIQGEHVAGSAQLDLRTGHGVDAVVDDHFDSGLDDRRPVAVGLDARRQPDAHPREKVLITHVLISRSRSMCKSLWRALAE